MNISIAELLKEEVEYRTKSLIEKIEMTKEELETLEDINFDEIELSIKKIIEEHDLVNNPPCIYVRGEVVEVDFSIKKPYEEVIEYDDANLSYNGKWISASINKCIGQARFSIEFEAKVPKDVKDTLTACGKLVTRTTTETSVSC